MNAPNPSVLALLAYRMHAISIGHRALRYTSKWNQPPAIEILFDGKKVIEGRATAFTNGAIESAIIHCRSLLEFLGLGAAGTTELRELTTAERRNDDACIERFPPLQRLTIVNALRSYPGRAGQAEAALAYVIYVANKGLAHTTASFTKRDEGSQLLDIAFRGVPTLVVNNFYSPLGIEPPRYKVEGRRRAVVGCE